MQRIFLPIILLILIVAIPVCVWPPTHGRASRPTWQSPNKIEQELIQLEHLLIESFVKQDFDTYASYLSDDYTEVRANVGIRTKMNTEWQVT